MATDFQTPEPTTGVVLSSLGETYPEPIVDHKQARERALEALSAVTGS